MKHVQEVMYSVCKTKHAFKHLYHHSLHNKNQKYTDLNSAARKTQHLPSQFLCPSESLDFISIQQEYSSLMDVIKAGVETLGGCQQDGWVAYKEWMKHSQHKWRCSCFFLVYSRGTWRELETSNMRTLGS